MADTADMNQHYIPQFLLRGFHTENEAQIWAFDKTTGRSFTTAIDTVASEHGFYNIGLFCFATRAPRKSTLSTGKPGNS
jgi:Protein of unknown function (DUF4238)